MGQRQTRDRPAKRSRQAGDGPATGRRPSPADRRHASDGKAPGPRLDQDWTKPGPRLARDWPPKDPRQARDRPATGPRLARDGAGHGPSQTRLAVLRVCPQTRPRRLGPRSRASGTSRNFHAESAPPPSVRGPGHRFVSGRGPPAARVSSAARRAAKLSPAVRWPTRPAKRSSAGQAATAASTSASVPGV